MADLTIIDLEVGSLAEMVTLFGVNDKYLKLLSELCGAEITPITWIL